MTYALIALISALLVISLVLAPRVSTVEGFYKGYSDKGQAPDLWTLILSQVTTWIFARSLMTAAILGFYYGIAGAIAYAAYYLSFVTGAAIIDHLRFRHGHENVQTFLTARFGSTGSGLYNFVVILRLLSEVFANLIVVGQVFGLTGSQDYFIAMLIIGVITFLYSASGGLRASLKTDVFQSLIVLFFVAILFAAMLTHSAFDTTALFTSTPDITSPGWVLAIVALLQVWSYPLHDPVMMDRGFLVDRKTTRRSFIHAAWISILAIFAFALLGVFAGLNKTGDEQMLATLTRLFGEPLMILFSAALIVSALSTLDSTFSSAAKLVVKDMKLLPPTVRSGRIVMGVFLVLGGLFLLWDSKDLYAAVAVSGTLSMFLLPVIIFSIWGNRDIAQWALLVTFAVTLFGGITYLTESSGYTSWMTDLFGYSHKYSKLLIICLFIAATGFITFALAQKPKQTSQIDS